MKNIERLNPNGFFNLTIEVPTSILRIKTTSDTLNITIPVGNFVRKKGQFFEIRRGWMPGGKISFRFESPVFPQKEQCGEAILEEKFLSSNLLDEKPQDRKEKKPKVGIQVLDLKKFRKKNPGDKKND